MAKHSYSLPGLAVPLVLGMLAALLVAASPAAQAAEGSRLADTRSTVTASTMISQAFFSTPLPEGSFITIGRSTLFPDNLGGSAYATAVGKGPLLLNPTEALDAQVKAEIERLLDPAACTSPDDFGQIMLLGGTSALSQAVEDELTGLGYCVNRRAGAGRVETSVEMANDFQNITRVFLARQDNPADSAAAGGLAGALGIPILVNPGGSLHSAVRAFLTERGITRVTLLGGTAALSDTVASDLAGMNITVDRLAGPSRTETSAVIAGAFPGSTTSVGLVNGFQEDAWAWALTAGAVGGRDNMPIVYGNTNGLSDAVLEFLRQSGAGTVNTFGPATAIPDEVSTAARDAAGPGGAAQIGTVSFNGGPELPLTGCQTSPFTGQVVFSGTYAAASDANADFELNEDLSDYGLSVFYAGETHTGQLSGDEFNQGGGRLSGTFATSTSSGAGAEVTVTIPNRAAVRTCGATEPSPEQDSSLPDGAVGTITFDDGSDEAHPITACKNASGAVDGSYRAGDADYPLLLTDQGATWKLDINYTDGEMFSGTTPATGFEEGDGVNGTISVSHSVANQTFDATVSILNTFYMAECPGEDASTLPDGAVGTLALDGDPALPITACKNGDNAHQGSYRYNGQDKYFMLIDEGDTWYLEILYYDDAFYSGSISASAFESGDGVRGEMIIDDGDGTLRYANVDILNTFYMAECPGEDASTLPDGAVGTLALDADPALPITACKNGDNAHQGSYRYNGQDKYFMLIDEGDTWYLEILYYDDAFYSGSISASAFESGDGVRGEMIIDDGDGTLRYANVDILNTFYMADCP